MSGSADALLLERGQQGLLEGLAGLGLTDQVGGQPAWPFPWRLALETLALDAGLLRRSAAGLALLAAAVLLALGGAVLLWRSRRRSPGRTVRAGSAALLGLTALLLTLVTPWSELRLALAPAVPSSFARSATAFDSRAIVLGAAVWNTHCADCHGHDARGEGPRAASLAMWPPDLTGGLLWRRREGELWWTVMQGRHDRLGRPTMPGFAGRLDPRQAWAVLDYLQAQAAGRSLRDAGLWTPPVPLPDAPVVCDGQPRGSLRQWRGQRLRIVAVRGAGPAWREDPRILTVALATEAGLPAVRDLRCRIDAPAGWDAYAMVAGVRPADLDGVQFIADRDGWLRARSRAGGSDWTEADLLCRADAAAATTSGKPVPLGFEALMARLDAEPVRAVRGGIPHGAAR